MMPDKHFLSAFQKRLRVPVCPPGARCQHKRADTGLPCNEPLDRHGWHAYCCPVGGSRTGRHNSLRDWHAPTHARLTGYHAEKEQRVPAWDRMNPRTGIMEEARLDVCTRDPSTGQPVFVDWSVTCEYSTHGPRRQARSNNDGVAAAQMVHDKRDRYPPQHGNLAPLVFESGGRPSDTAVEFIRSYGHGRDDAERAQVLGTFWRQISRRLQLGNAEMLLSALGQ